MLSCLIFFHIRATQRVTVRKINKKLLADKILMETEAFGKLIFYIQIICFQQKNLLVRNRKQTNKKKPFQYCALFEIFFTVQFC